MNRYAIVANYGDELFVVSTGLTMSQARAAVKARDEGSPGVDHYVVPDEGLVAGETYPAEVEEAA
jgi:hypothetical protein